VDDSGKFEDTTTIWSSNGAPAEQTVFQATFHHLLLQNNDPEQIGCDKPYTFTWKVDQIDKEEEPEYGNWV